MKINKLQGNGHQYNVNVSYMYVHTYILYTSYYSKFEK